MFIRIQFLVNLWGFVSKLFVSECSVLKFLNKSFIVWISRGNSQFVCWEMDMSQPQLPTLLKPQVLFPYQPQSANSCSQVSTVNRVIANRKPWLCRPSASPTLAINLYISFLGTLLASSSEHARFSLRNTQVFNNNREKPTFDWHFLFSRLWFFSLYSYSYIAIETEVDYVIDLLSKVFCCKLNTT